MLILIVIILLIILLLLAFTVKSFKLKGGSEIFKEALTQPNENDWEIPNLKPDRYFKSLLYRNFQDYKIRRTKIRGFVPKKIRYLDGGMDVKEFSAIARQRLSIADDSTFEPDFVINIGDDKTLIVEFDENNDYHQDNTVFR